MLDIERVDFVSVPTRDVARAREFYGDVLGLPQNEVGSDEFETTNLTLALWQPEAEGVPFTPNTAGIALRVPDVAAARARLTARDVEFLGETVDTGVCHMAFFYDPDGNVLILHRRYAPRRPQAKPAAPSTSGPIRSARVSLPPTGSAAADDASATPPILRLQTESGDCRDDPSEDAMFMFMEDLGPGNAWLEVERIGDRAGDAARVIRDELLECFDIDVRQGSGLRRSRGLAFRVAHEVLTGWAFDLPDWDGRVAWDSPPSAG